MKPGLLTTLTRLQRGQVWLTEHYARSMELETWPATESDTFYRSLDKWDDLERTVRQEYGFMQCVIGPEGCNEGAPIRCDVCTGRIVPVGVMIGCRQSKSPRKPTSGPTGDDDSQGALFRIQRSHD